MSDATGRTADKPLSVRERAVWHAIKKLSEVAYSVIAREIEVETGLSGADFGVLSRLEDLGSGRLGQKELTDSLEWDKSRLSHHLTRMEARGLLRREQAEGRGVDVAILPGGRRAISAARPVHARAVRKHILQFVGPAHASALLALAEHLQLM